MLSYRVTLDVPFRLALFVSRLLAEHRREIGTRDGTRALTCWKQAVFALSPDAIWPRRTAASCRYSGSSASWSAQGTAERALAVLREEGLIRSRMGRGHFVVPEDERG